MRATIRLVSMLVFLSGLTFLLIDRGIGLVCPLLVKTPVYTVVQIAGQVLLGILIYCGVIVIYTD